VVIVAQRDFELVIAMAAEERRGNPVTWWSGARHHVPHTALFFLVCHVATSCLLAM